MQYGKYSKCKSSANKSFLEGFAMLWVLPNIFKFGIVQKILTTIVLWSSCDEIAIPLKTWFLKAWMICFLFEQQCIAMGDVFKLLGLWNTWQTSVIRYAKPFPSTAYCSKVPYGTPCPSADYRCRCKQSHWQGYKMTRGRSEVRQRGIRDLKLSLKYLFESQGYSICQAMPFHGLLCKGPWWHSLSICWLQVHVQTVPLARV